MKKKLFVTLIAIAMISVTACGKGASNSETASVAKEAEAPAVVETPNTTEKSSEKPDVQQEIETEKVEEPSYSEEILDEKTDVWSIQSANVRSGPGTGYPVVAILSGGTQVVKIATTDNGWSKVQVDGKEGYIRDDLIVAENPKKEIAKETNGGETKTEVLSQQEPAATPGQPAVQAPQEQQPAQPAQEPVQTVAVSNNVVNAFGDPKIQAAFNRTNMYRQQAGLHALAWDDGLATGAAIRAAEVAVKWSHERPDGSVPTTAWPSMHGENLGRCHQPVDIGGELFIDNMMTSEPHKNAILNPNYTIVGYAYVKDAEGCLRLVQAFGW